MPEMPDEYLSLESAAAEVARYALTIITETRALDLANLQWEKAPRVAVERVAASGGGDHSDPTFDTVADAQRAVIRDKAKRVRAEVLAALTKLRAARAQVSDVERYLESL